MASISLDLRERILKALLEDSSSLRVAARFSVSASFVRKLRIQVQRTGNPRAGKAPGKERLVSGVKERKLLELVDKHPDATLVELAKLLERSARLSVSETTMWRSLRRLGLTRKKRVSARANARAQT
jgi:transposase